MPMTATQIHNMTLEQLRAVRTEMMSPRWLLSLEDEEPKTRTTAAKLLLSVQDAILKLENQALANIAAKLQAEEQNLKTVIDDTKKALEDVEKIAEVAKKIGKFLGVVGKIVSLL
jgi:hypothetical protein